VSDDAELAGGFEVPGLGVVAKSDRAPATRRTRSAARAHVGARLSETFDLAPGELVVHLEHGVGRFLGSTEVEVNGARSEVFTIEYADGGKLYVPVEHAHLLSRYVGVKGAQVKLHTLGGRRWTREKAAAQRAVQDLAAALLETQARRAVVPGFAYDVNPPGMEEFEASFPYEETPDQARAIADVKADLASQKPMDRLVCGDAGYGKTEVAMRAAFIAAMNGKQTVLLAPTTVLAEQHYESFLARFENTPVRIETLSRFVSNEAKKGVRARLLSGATDIVIGTHAVLSSKVAFHDLGLIVIDEEQRFGVKHKEHLKRLRATADVLTLSATPIPRTLYLSMTGARDLSILRTPPRERVAVESNVVRDTDAVVERAIRRELARGGQVYFLHNRVLTIDGVAQRVHSLVPEAKLDVAHGQMPSQTLAAKMLDFSRAKTDVLVCTTIVESGLDIPRANTILIDRADRLGLAELYQLRGRVGRSARQGYAFFLLPSDGLVDAEARERLDALKKHGGLGAGFNLALRDLEIRGAGNLLGSEQSGHIAAVGFQLYCQLLQRTIARLKGEDVPMMVNVSINLDFLDLSPGGADADECGACLPYDYVEDEAQRMDFHKRLAETASVPAVKRLRAELADRYGRLPRAAVRLVKLAELRVLCAEKGLAGVDVRGPRAVFRRADTGEVAFTGRVTGSTPDRKISSLFRIIEDGGAL
jgi:transcription-repair coupling factor (superfamily II helicase)